MPAGSRTPPIDPTVAGVLMVQPVTPGSMARAIVCNVNGTGPKLTVIHADTESSATATPTRAI